MSGSDVVIRRAQATDGAAVLVALWALAADRGDPFRATPDTLAAALFGPAGFARAHLAMAPHGAPPGFDLCPGEPAATLHTASLMALKTET